MRLRHIPEAQGIVDASRFVIHEPKEMRGCWKKDADRPLYLEIGMGKGRFIIEMASTHPEAEYLGIERYASVLFRACERMEGVPYRTPADKMERARIAAEERVKASEGGLQAAGDAACLNGEPEVIVQDEERDPDFAAPENLHFLSMDARELPEVFAEGEVDGIYLNFSDPWPKARHAKRRLTSRDFLGIYERVLAPGGVVEFKTDNRGLFDFSLEELKEAPHWELRQVTYDLHRDPEMSKGNIMTEYERKFSALGNKICKLVAVYLGQ